MMEEIREYVDIVFDQYEMTDEIRALRDEILMDAEEQYQDCLKSGMSEKEAVRTVKQSLGDLGGMLQEIGAEKIVRMDEVADSFYNAGKTLRNALGRLFADHPSQTSEAEYTDVESISITGVSLDVKIAQGEGNGTSLIINDSDTVNVMMEDKKLTIEESHNRHFHGARVTLKVPSLKDVQMDLVSGDIRIEDISIDNLNIKTTSGDVNLDDTEVKNCVLHTISGDVEVDGGKYETMEIVSKSGDVDISTEEISLCKISTVSGDQDVRIGWFAKMELGAVSGDIDVQLEDDEDLLIEASTVSGDCDINGINAYADGSRVLSIGTVSGDVEVGKD